MLAFQSFGQDRRGLRSTNAVEDAAVLTKIVGSAVKRYGGLY